MTRLYLDSANTADWAELAASGLCTRATCNPLLVQAAGLPVNLATAQSLAQSATRLGLEELHLQAWPDEHGNWEPMAQAIAALGAHIVVKLPAVDAAMQAAKVLCRQGTRVLVTALSNPLHALWAAEVGTSFVAPYVGRLNEAGRNATALLETLVTLQNQGGPRLLAASIRDLDTLGQVIRLGAYGVTLQKKLLLEGLADPQALMAVEQFERARVNR